MKKLLAIGIAVGALLTLNGCATSFPVGRLYTSVKLPVNATNNQGEAIKKGTASCMSILVLVATGNCGLEAVKKHGNIDDVTHVDWEAENILGLIGTYQVTAYGH